MNSLEKKTILIVFVSVLLLSSLIIAPHIVVRAATTRRVPQDYSKIQWAIGNASAGDTISVSAGTYYEYLSISKSIKLIGANSNTTIIDSNKADDVISISYIIGVTVSNFTIRNAGNHAGISVYSSSNNVLSGNRLFNNENGILLMLSNNNSLSDNSIFKTSDYGIQLYQSSVNKLFHNNIMAAVNVADDDTNTWDNGYPSGGNYWSDYTGVDVKKGPNQDQTGSDGIGDTPYIIDPDTKDRYPLMQPHGYYGEFRDIGITNFSKSRKSCQPGETVDINVTVFNYGTLTESPSITIYYGSTQIQMKTASNVLRGTTSTVTFKWNTTGVPNDKYTLKAYATPLPNEADATDNTFIDDTIRIGPIPGDIDGNGIVDIFDIAIVAVAFGSSPPSDPRADIIKDSIVDIFDIAIVAVVFGETL